MVILATHFPSRGADVIKLKAANYLPVINSIEKDREIQSVERSLDRISASITMLELNISDMPELF